ncbi:MAG TPA: hypothetical protein VM370_07950 [Candidatus Thermoplasmatota archaeon]|nr:hypothetical protein [Candidatus Thermoplasmatota archaeon]
MHFFAAIVLALAAVLASGAADAVDPGALHPDALCARSHAAIEERVSGVGWAEFCRAQMQLGSEVFLSYTQTVVSCTSDGHSCTYSPTFHADLTTLGIGTWVLRATTRELNYVTHAPLAGTTRSVACVVSDGVAACGATAVNANVVGSNFQSARWDGSWSLWLVDPLGDEHQMSSGASSGYLAQYCSCPG